MKSSSLLAAVLAGLTLPGHSADTTNPRDLTTLWSVGRVVEDRNGDSFADFVNARLITSAKASPGEIVAAANLAARLGLETTAMNLPLDRSTEGAGFAIVVGPGGAAAASLSTTDATTADLKPDEGRVRLTGDHAGTLFVGGATETGTMAAAEYVAARLPHAWDVKGPKLDRILTEIREALKPSGAVVNSITIPEAVVTTTGVSRLVAHIELASPADVTRARTALLRIGARATKSEKPALSYRSVALLRLTLTTKAASAATTVDIKGVSKPEKAQPIARRWSAAKSGLDLSSFYSVEGGLGDSDNNLIPDRTEVMISPSGDGTEGVIDLAARIGLESTGISIPLGHSRRRHRSHFPAPGRRRRRARSHPRSRQHARTAGSASNADSGRGATSGGRAAGAREEVRSPHSRPR
jgi:hypothetical protein